jgi:hypothetical protein
MNPRGAGYGHPTGQRARDELREKRERPGKVIGCRVPSPCSMPLTGRNARLMTVTSQRRSGGGYLERPRPSGLADVVEVVLDKGIVVDAYVRVSLVGIEILTVDARIVIASVDTYLRFAEATNRLDLYQQGGKDLFETVDQLQESGAAKTSAGAGTGTKQALTRGKDEGERPRRRAKQSAPR